MNGRTRFEADNGILKTAVRHPALITFIISFLVFLFTIEPDLTWANYGGDGGELITAAVTLGVPHPPGYPTYVLLGNLFGRLPVGTVAFRFHLLSALSTAIAAGLVTAIVARHHPAKKTWFLQADGHWKFIPAISAGLAFAFGSLVWSQAIIAEVYALNVALAGVFIYLLVRENQDNRSTLLAGIIWGLAVTMHLTAFLLLPLGLIMIPPRRWLSLAGGLLVGLTPFLVLPLLAQTNSPVRWGRPDTFAGWWWLVSARLYRPNPFGLPVSEWAVRVREWGPLFLAQFGYIGLPLILVGFYGRFKTQARLVMGLLLSAVLYTAYAFTYHTNDAVVLLLPALLLLSVILGFGLHFLGKAAIILPFMLLWLNLGQPEPGYYVNPAAPVRPVADRLLEAVPDDAVLITAGDPSIAALWYFHYVEGKRPDSVVIDGNLFQFDWYREQLAWDYPFLQHLTNDDLPGFITINRQERPVCEVSLAEPGHINC